jgi:hypothetical protein
MMDFADALSGTDGLPRGCPSLDEKFSLFFHKKTQKNTKNT